MNAILAALLINVYNFLYSPSDLIGLFREFNDNILKVYAMGYFGTVFEFAKVIGIGLLTVGMLISMMDRASEGDFTLNLWFRHLLKYFILYTLLMNSMTIFRGLFDISLGTFESINTILNGSIHGQTALEVDTNMLKNGFDWWFGLGSKLGLFMMLIIPYVISLLFTIVSAFFAASRTLEISIRFAAAPLVVGASYFGDIANSNIVRYIKRTMGIFFQIVVILVACASMTFVHNALVTSDSGSTSGSAIIANPASVLEEEDSKKEIEVQPGIYAPANGKDASQSSYTEESMSQFIYMILDPSDYFVNTAIMLSLLFILFKSRRISTEFF